MTGGHMIYHQLTDEAWNETRTKGLHRNDRGEKGDDKAIIRTDHFLDAHIPDTLAKHGLQRCNVIYGYLGDSTHLTDIETGDAIPIAQKATEGDRTLLRLEVDPSECWVSDLDLYDAVKNSENPSQEQAITYWKSLQPLTQYDGSIRRPEVMITTDLKPARLHESRPIPEE